METCWELLMVVISIENLIDPLSDDLCQQLWKESYMQYVNQHPERHQNGRYVFN